MASQIEHWFRLADEDRDGGVGGAEAVKFFTKSGLPQDVLGQIWEYSSGGGARLNMMQFGTAMRLVALAQASGNRLDPNQARMIAMGGGPQLPPPRLAGITGTPQPSIATYTPQITGLSPATSMAAGPTGGPYVPQPTGGYMPQVTGGPRPPIPGPYVQPQMTGMRPPVPAPYTEQPTGPGITSGPPSSGFSAPGSGPPSAGYLGAMPVGAGATGVGLAAAAGPTGGFPGLPGFPPVTPADMQRYQTAFVQTDTDRDGLVKGSECFPVFMLSGLDKALLKRMWDMVAGNAGSLTAEQFFKCMYIMDGCRRGAQLPAVMPPGPWPQVTMPAAGGITGAVPAASMPITAGPTGSAPPSMPGSARTSAGGAPSMSGVGVTAAPLPAENWSLENQFGPKGAQKAVADAYDQTLPKIPELPGKVTYDAQRPSISGLSTVPDLDVAVAGMLAPADKARWEAERQEALEKEQKQKEAEADAAAAKARVEAFQQALSELIMFKSRVDVALLQASDAAARLQNEAEETELRYNRARLAAQSQEEEGNAARQKLQALLARKQEAANKLELLQQELAMMQNLNPAELVALEKEVGKLVAEAAAAESKKAALEMQLDSGKKQKSLLAERITDLEMAAAAGEGDIRRAREELEYLQAKVSGAQDSAMGGQLGEVGPLLSKAASAYRRLYSSAAAAGVEVPYEANLNNVGALVWLEQLMAGTADWVDDDSMVSGYTVVNALPDLEGVPPALLRAAALAAEQQPPIKPTAVTAAQKDKDASSAAAATPAADGAMANGTAAAGAAPAAETGSPKAAGDTAIKGAAVAAIAAAAGEAAEEAETNEEVPAVAAVDASPSVEEEQSPAAEAVAPAAGADAAEVIETFAVSAVGPAADSAAAGFEDNAFGDNAFGDAGAFPAAAQPAPTPAAAAAEETVPLQQQEHVAGDVVAVAEESAPLDSTVAAADVPAGAVGVGDAAETAAAAEELPTAVADLPPSASEAAVAVTDDVVLRKSLADEDDSDVGVASPFHPAAMSAVTAVAAASGGLGGGLPLSGFDPSMYRLNTDQQQLAHQNSVDSSVAGSYFGGSAVAGATGATGASASGFEDDAFGDHSGQQKEGQGAVMAFEDNAF